MVSKTRLKKSSKTASGTRAAGGTPSVDWGETMVRREGAPPLRFKGRVLSCLKATGGPVPAAITLWSKKSGGYVGLAEAGERRQAASHHDLDDLMTWLEALCDRHDGTSEDDPLALTPALAVERITGHCLRVLAGRALDDWDRLQDRAG